jgi:hypothetical protein
MPKILGDFLHDLLKKAGQNVDDAKVKDFLSNTAMTVEIPDEVAKGLDNNLLSVTDAKNNHPEIKAHYTKSALDGVDSVINDLLKDLPDDAKAEITGERSSYKRISLVTAKIKELEAKKAGANKGDKDGLQKEIDALHQQLASQKKSLEEAEKSHKDALLKYRVESELKALFGRYKTTFDELDPAVKTATIKSLLDKELQDKEAGFTFDDKDNFTLLKKDGSNFYGENHQQVNPQAFIESLLSRHKLLVTTPKTGEKTPTNFQQPQNGGGKPEATGQSTFKQLVKESQTALNGQAAIM